MAVHQSIATARIFHLPEEPHHPEGNSTYLGFWIYLMSDCLIFAILF
ncbi:MAG: cytochrome o ubiquinol oxidase subunit III, partial [Sphingobacteriales bacterium]